MSVGNFVYDRPEGVKGPEPAVHAWGAEPPGPACGAGWRYPTILAGDNDPEGVTCPGCQEYLRSQEGSRHVVPQRPLVPGEHVLAEWPEWARVREMPGSAGR